MTKTSRVQRCRRILFTALAVMLLCTGAVWARPVPDDFFFEPRSRWEISTSFEKLSPNDTTGNWKNVSLSYYRRGDHDLTWFVSADRFIRREGDGTLGAAGAYMDWTDNFYTFTSFSGGSNTAYLPKMRVDHDLNFKFGKENNYIWTVGGTYIKYHNEYRDYIWSTGLTAYIDRTIVSYRFFRNRSNPGAAMSNTHEYSLGIGQDKREITTLTYSTGNQAYMASYLTAPELVDNDASTVSLNHRQWTSRNEGYFVELSKFNLKGAGGYSSKAIAVGFFKEY